MTPPAGPTRRAVLLGGAALAASPILTGTASSADLDRRVATLLARMTLEEKVAQLGCIWRGKASVQTQQGDFDPRAATKAFPHGIGQIARPGDRIGAAPASTPVVAGAAANMVNREPEDAAAFARAAQRWAREGTRLGIPLFLHEEGLHGLVGRGATSFPQAIALASTWDPELVEQVFAVVAREARSRGVNVVLAPVVDVARDPRWGRTEETFGEDPYLVGEMGLAAVRGLQGTTLPLGPDKVFAMLKHIAGHGQPENGTNVGPAPIGERTLREVFLAPFERIVRSFPLRAIMPSYNEIDGVPSHVNRWMLTTVLRDEWGFDGVVMTDYFALRQLVERHHVANDLDSAAALSLAAGVDVEMPDPVAFAGLGGLVQAGRVPMQAIDTAVSRVLRMKLEGGLFEAQDAVPSVADRMTATADARALARKAAARAMVLLKNDGVLPLAPNGRTRILVVGAHAVDTPIGGYSDVPRQVISVLDGMAAAAGPDVEVIYSQGVQLTRERIWEQDTVNAVPTDENIPRIAAAVEAARSADVVVAVLGENEQLSREAWAEKHLGDRNTLALFGDQDRLATALFDTGKPVVVLLLNGRPLSVGRLAERASALIEGWYLGQETGAAVADVLFGRTSPGGKLPITIPRSVGQLPMFYNHKPTARRGYLFGDTTPLFPFGFGLSYTRFLLSAPRLDQPAIPAHGSTTVSVEVRNIGSMDADEVVQLYIRDEVSAATRPVLELKAFRRIHVPAGQARTVHFAIGPDQLSYHGPGMRRVVEPGRFTILTGPNSIDLQAVGLTVTSAGDIGAAPHGHMGEL